MMKIQIKCETKKHFIACINTLLQNLIYLRYYTSEESTKHDVQNFTLATFSISTGLRVKSYLKNNVHKNSTYL